MHLQLYQKITHFQALHSTIWRLEHLVQKEQEELHEVFSVLEVKGITKVLAPFIIQKRVEWYRPYQVYQWQWCSPALIPPWFFPNIFSSPLSTTDPISTVSSSLTKIAFLLPHSPLTTTRGWSLQRLQWGWACVREMHTWLSLAPWYKDLHTNSLWGEDDCSPLFWVDSGPGVKEDWEVFGLEGR